MPTDDKLDVLCYKIYLSWNVLPHNWSFWGIIYQLVAKKLVPDCAAPTLLTPIPCTINFHSKIQIPSLSSYISDRISVWVEDEACWHGLWHDIIDWLQTAWTARDTSSRSIISVTLHHLQHGSVSHLTDTSQQQHINLITCLQPYCRRISPYM